MWKIVSVVGKKLKKKFKFLKINIKEKKVQQKSENYKNYIVRIPTFCKPKPILNIRVWTQKLFFRWWTNEMNHKLLFSNPCFFASQCQDLGL